MTIEAKNKFRVTYVEQRSELKRFVCVFFRRDKFGLIMHIY
jgi:hypothetical protein